MIQANLEPWPPTAEDEDPVAFRRRKNPNLVCHPNGQLRPHPGVTHVMLAGEGSYRRHRDGKWYNARGYWVRSETIALWIDRGAWCRADPS